MGTQELLGNPRRRQELPGAPRSRQEASGAARSRQETLGVSRQEPPGAAPAATRSASTVHGKSSSSQCIALLEPQLDFKPSTFSTQSTSEVSPTPLRDDSPSLSARAKQPLHHKRASRTNHPKPPILGPWTSKLLVRRLRRTCKSTNETKQNDWAVAKLSSLWKCMSSLCFRE